LKLRPQWKLGALAVAFWALLAGMSLLYSLWLLEHQASENALARARMLFKIIETTRLWNAERGGVYAAVDHNTPPNPLILDEDRDVVFNNRLFTNVNPAYMTRQVAELVQKQAGVVFNITSLAPIRPENAADAWETRALTGFEAGGREILERVPARDGQPAYRYMAALVTQEACLQCHARHGYKVGDVRGGISVTIPEDFVVGEVAMQERQTIILHAAVFLILSTVTLLFLSRVQRNWQMLEGMVASRTAELRQANAELQRIALYDGLTGLASRTLFEERLAVALRRADRHETIVSVTFIDLDGFKPINDTYGHQAGDLVLQTIAQRMTKVVRDVDTVARLGGDEFVLLMEVTEHPRVVTRIVRRLLAAMAQPIQIAPGVEISVHGSAGTAFYPTETDSAESLLAKADAAMYSAKQHSKATNTNSVHRLAGGVEAEAAAEPV